MLQFHSTSVHDSEASSLSAAQSVGFHAACQWSDMYQSCYKYVLSAAVSCAGGGNFSDAVHGASIAGTALAEQVAYVVVDVNGMVSAEAQCHICQPVTHTLLCALSLFHCADICERALNWKRFWQPSSMLICASEDGCLWFLTKRCMSATGKRCCCPQPVISCSWRSSVLS